jgi:alpha-glucosidase
MKSLLLFAVLGASVTHAQSSHVSLSSQDKKLVVTLSDSSGLTYRVDFEGEPILLDSHLGFTLQDGSKVGDTAKITNSATNTYRGSWEDRFGIERRVDDIWNQQSVTIQEGDKKLEILVRVFNNGIAIRYVIPSQKGIQILNLKSEETEFRFAADHHAWTGNPNVCAENTYPGRKLSETPNHSVLPALVETPNGFVAIAESDLTDWAGMFLKTGSQSALGTDLATRKDGKGAVSIKTPAQSPWRVIMVGRNSNDLLTNNLVKTLATPSRIKDTSWIKPGICAWDAWWANSVATRGTTETHKPYIDLASRMAWPYMLCDWGWYEGEDVTKPTKQVDISGLIEYAKQRKVKLFVWMHHDALNKTGIEKAFSTIAKWGVAGVKVDFMNSDSQETVQWYVNTLATAAKYKLMVDFHGAYKPTGLARTYPNYITQEGVLGNEWNKLDGNQCTIQHTMILPFTRGLLGPMDYTPGGFENVLPKDFIQDAGKRPGGNCQVLGTRAHQLALSMIYPSPLLVMCDSPTSYFGKDMKSPEPGLEFYRGLPTVWDETKVLKSEVGKLIIIARRSGKKWWLAAMNGQARESITIQLPFLGSGEYNMHAYMDSPLSEHQPKDIRELNVKVRSGGVLSFLLAEGGGGFVATFTSK